MRPKDAGACWLTLGHDGRMPPRDRTAVWQQVAGTTSLRNAHAHADSRHRRPLYDSLRAGFTSLEVDVWVGRGRVLVGHSVPRPWHSLRRVYLDPLAELVSETGCVYGDFDVPVQLLLDVKSDASRSRPVIESLLARYAGLVSCWRDGRFLPGAVTVVVSGTLSTRLYGAPLRWSGVDGRLRRAGEDVPADMMPLRSDCWPELFSWNGSGPMPEQELDRLVRLVADAHAAGQRTRLWDTPDRPGPARDNLWTTLLEAGVDYLNTDDLGGAREFLLARQSGR